MKLNFQTFKGVAPKIAPELLANELAQTAQNVRLESGQLKPWYNSAQAAELVNTGTILSIYLYEDSHWLEWEADVDLVLGPVSADTTGKFYYTGDGIPKKSNRALATTGVGAKPIDFYPIGMPVPHAALTAVNGGGGSGDTRSIQYVWTIVSSWNEESAPSPALPSPINQQEGDTVNLTNITMAWKAGESYSVNDWVFPVGSEGGTYVYKCVQAGTSGGVEPTWGTTVDADTTDNTVKWRCYHNNLAYKYIYRYVTGDQFGSYQFVDSIAIGVTTYADSKNDSELAESLSEVSYDPPPDGLKGLCYLGNGMMAGFVGKDLYVCEPYKPWAWPTAYMFSVPAAIVATKTIGETIVILTEEGPFLATGSDPTSLAPIPLPIKVACVAKRGAVSHGTVVAFPGPDGLYVISAGGIENFTQERYSFKEWQALYPATIHATVANGKYWMFFKYGSTEGALVIDLISREPTTLNFYREAAYTHTKTGKLYLVEEIEDVKYVYEWEGDLTQPLGNFTWKSKKVLLPSRAAFPCARVQFSGTDRTSYWALVEAYEQALARNRARISALSIGGSLGETLIGEDVSLGGDDLETPTAPAAYSGDDELQLKVYMDGNLIETKEVYHTKPMKIGSKRGLTIEVEVIGNVTVTEVILASSVAELKQGATE